MLHNYDEKQSSVRLNQDYIDHLDALAKLGGMNRHHLMISLINVWISVLNIHPSYFLLAITLREKKCRLFDPMGKPDYSVYKVHEKALPVKLTQKDIFDLERFASFSYISRHQLMRDMLIAGMEELEELIEGNAYEFGEVEPKLYKKLELLMKVTDKVFRAFIASCK